MELLENSYKKVEVIDFTGFSFDEKGMEFFLKVFEENSILGLSLTECNFGDEVLTKISPKFLKKLTMVYITDSLLTPMGIASLITRSSVDIKELKI